MTSTVDRSRTRNARSQGTPFLQNISLTRKEDWGRFVDAPSRIKPDEASRAQLDGLSDTARRQYNQLRMDWHANLGPFKTPQYKALHADLWTVVDSNLQDGDRVKGGVAVDAYPGLGKTTAVQQFARDFHLEQIAADGPRTASGHERWPVLFTTLTGNTTLRDLNRDMLGFYAHPGSERGTSTQFVRRALDCVLSCETKLFVIDDLHFLRWPSATSIQVSNHFKFIANTFPVTLVFVGVELRNTGLLAEGRSDSSIVAQTARRTTVLGLNKFDVTTQPERATWRSLLTTIEHRLVLAGNGRGMLADVLPDYLYERTSGHIGSLMTLVNRGCARAIRTGEESLSQVLLDTIPLDAAAEDTRPENAAALRSGKLRARMR